MAGVIYGRLPLRDRTDRQGGRRPIVARDIVVPRGRQSFPPRAARDSTEETDRACRISAFAQPATLLQRAGIGGYSDRRQGRGELCHVSFREAHCPDILRTDRLHLSDERQWRR